MFRRLLRSLIAFGVVFVAYQAYALLATPWLEPEVVRVRMTQVDDLPGNYDAVGAYKKRLAAYFPQGHWSQIGSPKFLQAGKTDRPVVLIVDSYEADDRGRVELKKCAVVTFPSGMPGKNAAPANDAVIIEAPGGAVLQFDENFRPSRGKVGRIVGGSLPGPITIRSGMNESGPEDDLLIETRDLQINESMIFTPHEVRLSYGKNKGGGRRLEIKLLEEEHGPRGSGLAIAGIESIEIFERVKLELHMGRFNPLSDAQKVSRAGSRAPTSVGRTPARQAIAPRNKIRLVAYQPDSEAATWGDGPTLVAPQNTAAPQEQGSVYSQHAGVRPTDVGARDPALNEPPLEVTCQGTFRMDMTRFEAVFTKRVHAWQLKIGAQSDQLTCEELRIEFANDDGSGVAIDPRLDPDVANRQRRALDGLQPRRILAIGDPVKLDSPSRDAQARGQSLSYDVATRRLTLDGGRTMIRHGANQVDAPVIRYEHPDPESSDPIGKLWVAGPGRMIAVPRDEKPDDVIEARWGRADGVDYPVQLAPNAAGNPVLRVLGRPTVAAAGLGQLTADRLEVLLERAAPDGRDGPAIELGRANDVALLPKRADAEGSVAVSSPQLAAETGTLSLFFKPEAMRIGGGDARGAGSSPTPKPQDQSLLGAQRGQTVRSEYKLTARRTRLEIAMRGRRSDATSLTCQGDVKFVETNPKPDEPPLTVEGQRLKVDALDTDAARLTIFGAAPGGAADATATLAARGVTVRATEAHLDQGKNRMWADGAGDAHVRTTRDMFGQSTAAATDLHLKWDRGLVFDGRRIVVRGNVFGQGPHDWIRTSELTATLSSPIDLGRGSGDSRIELSQVDCTGGVTIDHRTVDGEGQRSHERMQLGSLKINQQTGAIAGAGPGWVRSIHLSGAISLNDKPQVPQGGDEKLRLLRVHFQGGMAGNWKGRKVQFRDHVRVVYGPVQGWGQDLPIQHPHGLPPDTATLHCELLTVNEDPMARGSGTSGLAGGTLGSIGPLELRAERNVRIEGASDDGGLFNAMAHAASYSQTHERFILEGNGLVDAKLWVRKTPTDPPADWSAGKVSYWRKTGDVKVENFKRFDFAPTATQPRTTR